MNSQNSRLLVRLQRLISRQSWRQKSSKKNDTGYDVIVVGGGHAGTEAASAAARMGADTLLVTHKVETIGAMSCNPSFGGIGKGHLLREVDALDGVCARICDKSGIQYKILNKTKGPAVWGLRAQIDRDLYKSHMKSEIEQTTNLTVMAAPVEDLLLGPSANRDKEATRQCSGVILDDGRRISGKSVVLTTGTFLRGCINIGLSVHPAGRLGDEPAVGLAKSLEDAGFRLGRLKTGTPPRIDERQIDYSKTQEWKGDNPPTPFSFVNDKVWIKAEDQVSCYMTHTNEEVEKIVMETLHLNKHVQEEITGPRFCPSIESKILRFKQKKHQVWLEIEGLESPVVYPSGIACTMPEEHQLRLVRAIPGLEKCDLIQPGYGVEYDFIDPRQLRPSLETLLIDSLFLAGQINGTTGYEEAAAQGVIAGINAALKAAGKPAFTVDRTEGYIGVLVDDLTTQGTNEPYRMFTSRAEFRLSLRPDNADIRLTSKGYDVGCVGEARYQKLTAVQTDLTASIALLSSMQKSMWRWKQELGLPSLMNQQRKNGMEVLRWPDVTLLQLVQTYPDVLGRLPYTTQLATRIEIEAMYASELQKQLQEIAEVRRDEKLELPQNLDYYRLNLSSDSQDKLAEAQPATIAAASRIPGITPAAIVILLRYVKYGVGIRGPDAKSANAHIT